MLWRKSLIEWFLLSVGLKVPLIFRERKKCCLGLEKFWKAVSFLSVAFKVSLIFRNMETLLVHFKIYQGAVLFIISGFECFINIQKMHKINWAFEKIWREMFIVVCRLAIFILLKILMIFRLFICILLKILTIFRLFLPFVCENLPWNTFETVLALLLPLKFHGLPKRLSFFSCAPDWHGMVCYLKRWTPQRTSAFWEVPCLSH